MEWNTAERALEIPFKLARIAHFWRFPRQPHEHVKRQDAAFWCESEQGMTDMTDLPTNCAHRLRSAHRVPFVGSSLKHACRHHCLLRTGRFQVRAYSIRTIY